jgi:hypothetical protein
MSLFSPRHVKSAFGAYSRWDLPGIAHLMKAGERYLWCEMVANQETLDCRPSPVLLTVHEPTVPSTMDIEKFVLDASGSQCRIQCDAVLIVDTLVL